MIAFEPFIPENVILVNLIFESMFNQTVIIKNEMTHITKLQSYGLNVDQDEKCKRNILLALIELCSYIKDDALEQMNENIIVFYSECLEHDRVDLYAEFLASVCMKTKLDLDSKFFL